jgi:hypothetical protein
LLETASILYVINSRGSPVLVDIHMAAMMEPMRTGTRTRGYLGPKILVRATNAAKKLLSIQFFC